METKKKPRWTVKKKSDLVLELIREKRTAGEICREHGISQSTLYEWRNIFLAKGREGLQYGG
jgi:transposase